MLEDTREGIDRDLTYAKVPPPKPTGLSAPEKHSLGSLTHGTHGKSDVLAAGILEIWLNGLRSIAFVRVETSRIHPRATKNVVQLASPSSIGKTGTSVQRYLLKGLHTHDTLYSITEIHSGCIPGRGDRTVKARITWLQQSLSVSSWTFLK